MKPLTEFNQNKPSFLIKAVFWMLMIVFLFVICQFFVPSIRDLLRNSNLFLLPLIIFSLLGLVLIILVIKGKIEGKLRKVLLLTGVSSAGFFAGVLLHNLFYALGIFFANIAALSYLMGFLHTIFFSFAIFVCPLGFLFGAIGSIFYLLKKQESFDKF